MADGYVHNQGLFASAYFDRLLADLRGKRRRPPADPAARIETLRALWRGVRKTFMRDSRASAPQVGLRFAARSDRRFTGLPESFEPLEGRHEDAALSEIISPVLQRVLGYRVEVQRSLLMTGEAAREVGGNAQRPDVITFADAAKYEAVVLHFGERDRPGRGAANGVDFCRSASMIVDAKRFNKGVGADESDGATHTKRNRVEPTALDDIKQVERYLRGYDRNWGVLTNGRSWRLVRKGKIQEHVRFDLILWLEDMDRREVPTTTAADLAVFDVFWHLFGPPAADGFLDDVERESSDSTAVVRDVLRRRAYEAVEVISRGFWSCPANAQLLPVSPAIPTQAELDRLREVSLTLLYRFLFILKAEAQNLLPMLRQDGTATGYAREGSTRCLYAELHRRSFEDRSRYSKVYQQLRLLFTGIDQGDPELEIPAYNGGLFDAGRHPELANWRLLDQALFEVLHLLIYLGGGENPDPVPYADLDVRDLGDIYEGLLEQRLVGVAGDPPSLHLANEKGERKASGSYFTPDGLVDHLTRRALLPLLDACGDDPAKVLALRVLDPAMGSGHFLVKAVDVMADYLTSRCDPVDADAPRDNGPAEYAYWKRRVVENCIYGVDYNPMAVELARVALWLYTAEQGKPLSFLDHHLKVGNSLVGVTLDRLAKPALHIKLNKGERTWEVVAPAEPQEVAATPGDTPKKGKKRKGSVAQLPLPFPIDTTLFQGILASIRSILAQPSDSARDVKAKGIAYAKAVEQRLAAHRLLADLWCLQWFIPADDDAGRAWNSPNGLYDEVKRTCGLPLGEKRDAALAMLGADPWVAKVKVARSAGSGPRVEAFFHWQLEFPEVAFGRDGQPREGFGFDAVIGNPPWDKIKPERRQFYGPYGQPEKPGWDVANTQGASLDALIDRLHQHYPGLERAWATYESTIDATARFLRHAGVFRDQIVLVQGKSTGGDPDTFRYFVERSFRAVREGGRVALVVPGALWQAEGCTGLRQMLFSKATVEETFIFENYRRWAFDIHTSTKFTTFVAAAIAPAANHSFPAAFMLRDLRAVAGLLPERIVRLTKASAEALSPGTLGLLDVQSQGEEALVAKIHRELPGLGTADSGWGAQYRCDVHMTAGAWRFKSREWMQARGFLCLRPVRQPDGSWLQSRDFGSPSAEYLLNIPDGGEYWLAAEAEWYEQRQYEPVFSDEARSFRVGFIHPKDAAEKPLRGVPSKERHLIVPDGIYTALYEGRMVHNFDHAQKAYQSGQGRKAVWSEIPVAEKRLQPRVFSLGKLDRNVPFAVGFCDVTGATNERSLLAALLPKTSLGGHKVPYLTVSDSVRAIALTAVVNSFVCDFLVRLRVSTSMTWTFMSRIPVPRPDSIPAGVSERVALLSCTTPELADVWNEVFPASPWTYDSAERDPWTRGVLRAELDAIIAELYGLSVPEYARILAGFPLLDRDQPALSGDAFVTQADEAPAGGVEGVTHETMPFGVYERKPRSFITRDLALLTFMRRRKFAPPQDLPAFFRDEVGIDPRGPLSRFRIGELTDLIDRVKEAQRNGAVAYAPSSRGGGTDAPDGDEDSEGDDAAAMPTAAGPHGTPPAHESAAPTAGVPADAPTPPSIVFAAPLPVYLQTAPGLTLILGPDLDAGALLGSTATASFGLSVVGPSGFADRLETALGLSGPILSTGERAAELVPVLLATPGFWTESAKTDPLGVARQLLHWRDTLRLSGWRGESVAPRLDAVADVTANVSPGLADRLNAVCVAINERDPEIATVILVEPAENLPRVVRDVLAALVARGTLVRPLDLHAATASGDLMTARSQGFRPTGDGTLELIRPAGPLEAAEAVAAWLATDPNREGTVIIGADAVLDAALHRHGLPTTGGSSRGGGALLQLLPLVLALGWAPTDPQRALELLTLPLSPIRKNVSAALVGALQAWPAVGSESWDEALADALAAIPDEAVRDVQADRVQTFLYGTVFGAAYPAAEARRRVDALATWMRGRASMEEKSAKEQGRVPAEFGPALGQAQVFKRLLDLSGLDPLTAPQLRRLVDDATAATSESAPHVAQAGLRALAGPAGLLGPAAQVVWWSFRSDTAPGVPRLAFSRHERHALAAIGVDLPTSSAVAMATAARWRRPLLQTTGRLVLVCPVQGEDGAPAHPHPLWDEIVAGVPASEAGRLVRASPASAVVPSIRSPLALPLPQHAWTLPAGSVKVRKLESPSSLGSLVGCSLQWVLNYHGKVRAGKTASLPAKNVLWGNVAHDIVARVLDTAQDALPAPSDAEAQALSLFDSHGPRMATQLFRAGNEHERERVRTVIGRAAGDVVGALASAGLTVKSVEKAYSKAAFGTTLEGTPDLVAKAGAAAVIDLKWGGGKYRAEELQRGTSTQLAAYSHLVREDGPYPPVAYFILTEQRLYTTDPTRFKGGVVVAGAGPEATWLLLQKAWDARWAEVQEGDVQASGHSTLAGELPPEKSEVIDGQLVIAPGCGFCDYGTLCGKTRCM